MFKSILAVVTSWVVASFIFYILGASLTSFAEMRNNFDITDWSKAGRAIYFIFSLGCLVASIVQSFMALEKKNV